MSIHMPLTDMYAMKAGDYLLAEEIAGLCFLRAIAFTIESSQGTESIADRWDRV